MLDDYQATLVLELLGRIATVQPMNSYSFEAETLLKKIGHQEYLNRCLECDSVPAESVYDSAGDFGCYLCRSCRH